MNTNSAEYEKSMQVSNEAIKNFKTATLDYRARVIGDTEYLAAKNIYDAAMAEYDKAYAKEQN